MVSTQRPAVLVVDCPVEAASPPSEWPLLPPQALMATDFLVDGNSFTLLGVSNDADTLLSETLEKTLAEFTVSEPEGGPSDVLVSFQAASSEGRLLMADEDEDGCWDVELAITFLSSPGADDLVRVGDRIDSTIAAEVGEPGSSAGTGSVTTAQGTFPLFFSRCSVVPLDVVAVAPEGELRLSEEADGTVILRWTYSERGVLIEDVQAKSVISSETAALVVGDGQGLDGAETVLADLTCE